MVLKLLAEETKMMCNYLLSVDGGHLPQRWSCGDRGAEIRPSQNHCRSGSRVEFAPVVKAILNFKSTLSLLGQNNSSVVSFQSELLLLNAQVCPWWWGWRHTGRAFHPPPCRLRLEPALSSPPGTAGTRILGNTHIHSLQHIEVKTIQHMLSAFNGAIFVSIKASQHPAQCLSFKAINTCLIWWLAAFYDTFRWKVGFALCFVGPVHHQVTKTAKAWGYFIWGKVETETTERWRERKMVDVKEK